MPAQPAPKKIDTSWLNNANNQQEQKKEAMAPPKKVDTSWMKKTGEEEKKE